MWARTIEDECEGCGMQFTAAEMNHCVYHPDKPIFTFGSNIGVYACCSQPATRFDPVKRKGGCCSNSHNACSLTSDSIEWKFIQKHNAIMHELEESKLPG